MPIEPRIKQRRIDLQRASGRRRLRLVLAGLGVVATIGAALAVLHSPLVRVRTVAVDGAVHIGKAEIAAAAKIGPRTPMVDINPSRTALSVGRLPWVKAATVDRHWPGTVAVHVVERSPIAQIQASAGGWAEVDVSGKVLDRSQTAWPGLVRLVGFGNAGQPGSTLADASAGLVVAGSIPPSVTHDVTQVLGDRAGQTSLELSGGVRVLLGPPTDVKAKMSALATMLDQVDTNGARVLDLQVPDAPTLT